MFQDIAESTAKQFIDVLQLWDVLQDAERRGAKYTGSMFWRKTGTAKTEYLIKEIRGIEKSLGCRSPDTEHIMTEFKRNKAESSERLKALRDAMKKQQRVNFALRIGRTPNTVIAVLNAIADAGISEHFLVVGTNALYAGREASDSVSRSLIASLQGHKAFQELNRCQTGEKTRRIEAVVTPGRWAR